MSAGREKIAGKFGSNLGVVSSLLSGDKIFISGSTAGDHYPLAEVLEAVADAADVVVIPRADLPAVDEEGFTKRDAEGSPFNGSVGWSQVYVAKQPKTAQTARRMAMHYLAVAEYLDANPPNPPVDEAEVEALAEFMGGDFDVRNNDYLMGDTEAIARRLVAAGWKR